VTTTTTTTTQPAAPPANAVLPTRANTGPTGISGTMTAEQFLQTGVCDHRRIVDQVRDESGRMLGRNFSINSCALDGGLYYVNYGSYPDSQFPVITIQSSSIDEWIMFSPMRATVDHSYVTGAFWSPCPDCAGQDHQPNQISRAMPITVTNSLFWKPLPPADSPYHSEGLHVVGAGIGYSFTNTRFVQEGPYNGTQTGAIKFTGRDSTFTNVTFDWGGTPAAAYSTVYFEGSNIRVNGCRIARGLASYEFPTVWSDGNGYVVPPLTGCVDFDSGAPVG
jgi:hypothetical protein